MPNILRNTLAAVAIVMAASLNMQAQTAEYPDYNALRDTLGNRMMAFYMQHTDMDMGQEGFSLLSDLDNSAMLKSLSLPPTRKKTLGGGQVYPLSKPSTLVVCQVDYRPESNDFYLDIIATAVALTADGACLTNHHVFEDILPQPAKPATERHYIRFAADCEGNLYPVKSILLTDSLNDFSLFTVDLRGGKLKPMPIGTPAVEGEDVYCLSHPKGNLYYMTKGIVARNQSLRNPRSGAVKYEMQITADYALCSSGGPIIDTRGNLIGIVGSTNSLYGDPNKIKNFQMSIKKAVPIKVVLEKLNGTSKKKSLDILRQGSFI